MSIDLITIEEKREYELLSQDGNDSLVIIRPLSDRLESQDFFTSYYGLMSGYSGKNIVFDMINITRANSGDVGFLLSSYKKLDEKRNRFRVCNCNPRVRRCIETAHAIDYLPDYNKTLDQVLGA